MVLFSPSPAYGEDTEQRAEEFAITAAAERGLFSPDLLYRALVLYVENPEIVYGQALLESGHFSSTLFLESNNLLGMKHPKVRETLSTGEFKGFSVYANWLDCVKDYALWQKYYKDKGHNMEDYYAFLGNVYCPEENYVNLVKQLI